MMDQRNIFMTPRDRHPGFAGRGAGRFAPAGWSAREGAQEPQPVSDPGSAPAPADAAGDCAARDALTGYPLAMVYMPDHDFDGLYDGAEALARGTLFSPLDLPFCRGCGR